MIKEEIWIEKYRPKKLDDIVGQVEVIKRLKSYIKSRNLPHLLFSGPAGTGKTSAAICLAREYFGDDWSNNFTELNASDERGIEVVRNKIKNFARMSPISGAQFKIVFLDEADALTFDAQSALRRTMERYTSTCRFILSCNYTSKIIEPIQSRCAMYRFGPIKNVAIEERVKYIGKEEGLTLNDDSIDAIKYVAVGDMRKAVNALQAAAMIDKNIEVDTIYKASTLARPEEIIDLIKLSLEGNFDKAREKLNFLLLDQGISGNDIIIQIYRTIIEMPMSDKLKISIIDHIADADFRLAEGANEKIQLEALISYMMLKE